MNVRENRLMEVRYQDSAQGIMLTGYADTVIADPQYRLVGIRFGGYPEMVQGMSAAICGGATVTVSAEEQTYVSFFERWRDRKVPFRLIVLDSGGVCRLNMPCTVDTFEPSVRRNGDIAYTIAVTEYRFVV